jgi:septum formation protein
MRFSTRPVEVDERPLSGESPEDYVLRVARDKARACARSSDDLVLAADTVVVIDGLILGKPIDDADAVRMLRRLSGRVHQVLTGVALHRRDREVASVETTAVTFESLSMDEIGWYVASGEPRDKAGAYAVQGLASRFVTRIDGSYSNVVGLPVARVYRMVADLQAAESASPFSV